jgi:quaternary ammonium compound-resistance protein SugE
MAWVWLVFAGILEIVFAIFLKLSDGFSKPLFTTLFIVAAGLSLYCLSRAMQVIPVGTAYAVWTGIGTAGVALLGIILFSEPVTPLRLFFMATLLASIIGLKLA